MGRLAVEGMVRGFRAGENEGEGENEGAGDDDIIRTLTSQRIVFLSSDINEHTITNVQAQFLAYAAKSRKPIHLIISTYGGSVDEMFSLYDLIRFLPCPVHTVGLGKVQSAGVLLMAAGAKGRRLIGVNSSIMIHPLSCDIQGNIFELDNTVQEARRKQQHMTEALLRETKMSRAKIRSIMRAGHDSYMSSDEAIKLGIADRLIGVPSKGQNGFV